MLVLIGIIVHAFVVISIGFAVANLEEKIALLEQRDIKHSPVISPAPNTRFVFFTDMNGCEIQLVERNGKKDLTT